MDYNLSVGDNGKVIKVDTSSEPVVIILPTPVDGYKFTIKDIKGTASLNSITVKRNASELIDGAQTDVKITENFASLSLISDGTNWFRCDSFEGKFLRKSGRGLFGGGVTDAAAAQNTIDYVRISTTGNATDFGDLTQARAALGSAASPLIALFAGGIDGSGATRYNTIDYVNISTAANALDFGDLRANRGYVSGCGNTIRAFFLGGEEAGPTVANNIEFVNFSSLSNAFDFGDLTVARYRTGSLGSTVRGVTAGGLNLSSNLDTIDYITYSVAGNSTDFGDLTLARRELAGASNSIRGLFAGGLSTGDILNNIVDYVTIATTGNALDFGDLSSPRRENSAGCASSTRALFGGGNSGLSSPRVNTIDYFQFSTLSNATDFGDITIGRGYAAGCSSSHGGLYV